MNDRQRTECAIIDYLVLHGATVDNEVMIIDVSKCEPISAAQLREAIEVDDTAPELKNWTDLAVRLRQYAFAVSSLGGMNNLDKVLYMAADGVEGFGQLSEVEQGPLLTKVFNSK